jgi:hypothetical protein
MRQNLLVIMFYMLSNKIADLTKSLSEKWEADLQDFYGGQG